MLDQLRPRSAIALFWRLVRPAGVGRARGILRVWPLWERLARRIWPVVPVPGAPHGIFDLHFARYRGTPFVLPDGTPVRRDDRVAELHLNNQIVVSAARRDKWSVLSLLDEDLRALAAWILHSDSHADLQAVYGVTLLSRATVRLGFTPRERPVSVRTRLDRFFMTGLLALYSPEGLDRLTRGKTYGSYPKEIWISRAELLRRYGRNPA